MDGESSKRNMLESIVQGKSLEPRSLPLEDLREITNNFSDERLLGEGGFGKVYKGVLQNGDMIAVKKLMSTSPGIGDKQFENEVRLLMRLRHTNIVQLVGYCSETENILAPYNGKYVYAEKSERLLCLEFLPKGSLHEHLSDESSGLDWETRYKIIEGICYGLHYLHEEWKVNTPIIHMDLKPPNILLDDNMVPKITDFGLSRLFGEEQTRTCTTSREGTLGYMAPEYLNRGIITKKLDIFSLGVIIIEIITGHKNYPYEAETETSSEKFIELVLEKWENRQEKAPDYPSTATDHYQQIRRCIQIGLGCVKLDWEQRPTTRQIIEMLHGPEGTECSNKMETYDRACIHSCLASSSVTANIDALLSKLSSPSREDQRFAAAGLRVLSRQNAKKRICIAEAGAIPLLSSLLSSSDLWTQENAVTALLNLSIEEDNKASIISCGALPSIVHVLNNGSMEARENAAAMIISLSMKFEYMATIGRTGVIPDLVVMLNEGSRCGKKDAAQALHNLCLNTENKESAIRAGVVPLIMGLLVTEPMGDLQEVTMGILSTLSSHPEGLAAIGAAEPVPVLVEMIGRGTPRIRENAAAVMFRLCIGEQRPVPLWELTLNGTVTLKYLRYFDIRRSASHSTRRLPAGAASRRDTT